MKYEPNHAWKNIQRSIVPCILWDLMSGIFYWTPSYVDISWWKTTLSRNVDCNGPQSVYYTDLFLYHLNHLSHDSDSRSLLGYIDRGADTYLDLSHLKRGDFDLSHDKYVSFINARTPFFHHVNILFLSLLWCFRCM